jgi:hypothetical protein
MLQRNIQATAICGIFLLAGCGALGAGSNQQVGSTSASVPTAYLSTSVPYYICNQKTDGSYSLIPPAKIQSENRDIRGPSNKDKIANLNLLCKRTAFQNGDPLTLIIHRVGLNGLAEYRSSERHPSIAKCFRGCTRDIAVVIDVNAQGGEYQAPIVAFYQRGVPDGGHLQFNNLIIYAQAEWFRQNPPVVRIRMYDVRDDKNADLKSRLDIAQDASKSIGNYLAGASSIGPAVELARRAADMLIRNYGNRSILDMEFQLYPAEFSDDETFASAISTGPLVVFSEEEARLSKSKTGPKQGGALPNFTYLPDAIQYGGAGIYSNGKPHKSPFVVVSLNRFEGTVAASVSRRIQELSTKFSSAAGVSDSDVDAVGQIYVDSRLAQSIDRFDKEPKMQSLIGLIGRYDELTKKVGRKFDKTPDDYLRRRAERKILVATGCDPEGKDLDELLLSLGDKKIEDGKTIEGVTCIAKESS